LSEVEIHTELGKPDAVAYVDDRAVHFEGDYEEAFEAVLALQREHRRKRP
jgi:hypothetical protein